MSAIVSPPPSGVKLSWNELTAPVEVSVVELANSALLGTPNRVSLPSIAACAAIGAAPWWAISKAVMPTVLAIQMTAITATMAKPWRLSLTSLPKVRGRLNGISSRKKISNQLLNGFGFSNGWAELAL